MRQPLETGRISIARANAHVTYPARFQLVAAMNPCRCGHLADPARACARAPRCGAEYQEKLSGPLLDRIDLVVEVPAVNPADLTLPASGESSGAVAVRVAAALDRQQARQGLVNAGLEGQELERVAQPDPEGRKLLAAAAERLGLSARAWHRVLKLARTVADLDKADQIGRAHIAEALSYRRSLG